MDVKSSEHAMTVAPLGVNEALWEEFLSQAANGTLFHDLHFLRYHPEGRFRFHHLILMRHGKPIGLVPGGLTGSDERPLFCSPLGASIGGMVVGAGLRAGTALAMVETLQEYARGQGWAGIELTLPPSYYSFETAGLIEFALFCRGFRLQQKWLCPVLQLEPEPNAFERTYTARQASYVRAARRKGVRGLETGVEGLENFIVPFRDTYDRHAVPATHTEDEIRDLLVRLPERVRIHLAMLDGVSIAALLVFRVTKRVAYTFYICRNSRHENEHGPAFLIAELMDRLYAAGFRYLDLGPTASDEKFNKGVTFFKEGLGAVGHCRDRWRWMLTLE
jgi:Acetyltransferase (GNAT) domain